MDAAPCIIEGEHGCCTLHAAVYTSLLPQEDGIVRFLLSFARDVHHEPVMLERGTATTRLQLEGNMNAIPRMLEEEAEDFLALPPERNA